MNKKVKKVLKWAGIGIGIIGTGVGAYALITHPEVRGEIVDGVKKGCGLITSPFKDKNSEVASEAPRREGRNSGGYYKPRYNNKKN